ncbi:MAG: hydantoinase/oxoprolinase family protein [Pseudomonadota bacterium]
MSIRISTDIGGTFTDLIVCDETGLMRVFKSPTTPARYSEGIIGALEVAAEEMGRSVADLLRDCSTSAGGAFIHGSTITTNAVLQGRVAKVGLITTRGFRDTLTIRHGGEKKNPYNLREKYLPPYVPRYLTMEVTERMNSEGEIVVPLDEDDVRRAVRELKKYKVEVIAVCLIWDIMNQTHAQRIGELIKEEWPGAPYVLAVDLNPCLREVWRTSSACIDASLQPIVGTYMQELDSALKGQGYGGQLSILTSTGGIQSVEESLAKPIYTIDCGPACAPVAGRAFGDIERKTGHVLTMDMGGTSFDISSVIDGQIAISREAKISGYDLGIAKVDSRSIGAGGGSIAWVDPGGLCHVGPQSAQALPGPACYGKGGQEPTVTDANLVLGFLNPDYYLGGRMKLYPELAEKAILEKVAQPLGLSLKDAAFTIYSGVNVNMVTAIEELTIWQGIDPIEYLFVAGGAAAGLHVVPICRELGTREALMPKTAGGLSAVGGLFCNIVGEFAAGFLTESHEFNYEEVNKRLAELDERGIAFLDRMGIAKDKRQLEYYCEARYPYQIWELPVALRVSRLNNENDLNQLVEDFHGVHERVFAVREETHIECIHWRLRAIGVTEKPRLIEIPMNAADPAAALIGRRQIYLGPEHGEVEAAIYAGDKLKPGNKINPPSIIEEATTTLAVLPGSKIEVTKFGNYFIQMSY